MIVRIEQREVTTTETVYIANDGMEFRDEDECEGYEMLIVEKSLRFYTHDFKRGTLDNCSYVNLVTEQDVNSIKVLCLYHGISSKDIDEPGVYWYNDRRNCWLNLTEVMNNINAEKE